MAYNREHRRAQLKQLGKKFNGLDITRGTYDIDINGGEEKITIDFMNFDTLYYLSEMADKFSNIQDTFADELEEIDSIQDASKKSMKLIRLYKKIIDDFTFYVDKVFGEGATKRIFGNEAPMPAVIGEFIDDISPILTAVSAMMKGETANPNSIQSMLSSQNLSKYSGGRLGNV